jgi:hypothetical protein
LEFFTDKDLSDPKRYLWLGGQPLWEWVSGDTYNHDAEHLEQLRLWREKRGS